MGLNLQMPCPKCRQTAVMNEVGHSERSKSVILYQCSKCFAQFEVGEAK